MRAPAFRRAAKSWVPSSLGARLLIGATTMIIVALVLTGVAIDFALGRFVQGQVDGRVDGQLVTVDDALRLRPDGVLVLERSVDGPPFDRPGSGWYWEVLAPGPVLRSRSLDGGEVEVGPPGPPGPHGGPLTADATGPSDEPLRARLWRFVVDGRPVTIVATTPLAALRGPLREAMTPLISILALLGLGLLGGVVLQVRLGLRPLGRLRADLARVRAGRDSRIEGARPREIRPLVDELNLLLDESSANLERARRNVANLAHGLKTPLATLALAVDDQSPPSQSHLRPLINRMDRLIRHHLTRARAAALGGAARARVALAKTTADHIVVFAKLQVDKALTFDVEIGGEVDVAVEAQDLDEVLGNLLDNAGKWARRHVRVIGMASGPRVVVMIEDDGPGIPEDRAGEMIEPGRRIDEGAPGHGFGLPIARELVELYGGSLALSRSDLGGLAVTIDLPAAL